MESHVGSSQRSSLPGLKRKRTDEVSAPRIGLAQRTKASEPRLGETPTDDTRAHAEPLPDPKIPHGPYRPFTSDPGWSEAWWWLGLPLFVAAFTIGSYWLSAEWYDRGVLPEGYGIVVLAQFFIPLFGL